MTHKRYDIFLDGNKIGTSALEHADPPMGVVFGTIDFDSSSYGYDFFKMYCLEKGIEPVSDYPEDKLLTTAGIPGLKIMSPAGIEIKGDVTNIEGMDSAEFTVTICGIPYPFYEEEFPHHIQAYKDRFGD